MTLASRNPPPPARRELGLFGVSFPLMLCAVGALVLWRADSWIAAIALWGAAGMFAALYAAIRPFRAISCRAWTAFGRLIGLIISRLLLGTVFFALVTPMGLVLRLLRKDPLQRAFDRKATSYWIPRRQDDSVEKYLRQF
jgi:hypothetical protein